MKNPFLKVFVDESDTYAGFRWWLRWTIARFHLRQWLRYEGLPLGVVKTDEMLQWWDELREMQNRLKS